MLEQLGLGIVLSFQDNFTPQANNAITSMLKLETQAEQMAGNVQKSLNNLQNLMLSGFSLSQIGDEFQKLGKTITGVFEGAFKSIASASSQMETYKAQFKTVFGDEAQKQMDWAVKFAVQTPFELKDLISSMQKMGSQKIDVSKMFKNSKGQEKAFMEYMGDLATRNMSANGGVEGMGIAISNAWAGQLRSMEQRFDIAKQDLSGLKEYAGKDQAKFMEEFVKLADKYAPNAMKNLEGTWAQTMSNMDDAWFNMMFRLGDKDGGSDVFGSMKKSLNTVSELLFEVSSNGKMLGTLRGIFQDLWQPIDKLVNVLTSAVREIFKFAEVHPQLTKFIAKFTAITGVVLIAVGAFMKLTGGVMIFTTSLVSAYANLKILSSLNLGGELSSIIQGFGTLGSLVSSSVLAVGALGLAYKFNIGGAREDVNKLIDSFKNANSYKEKLLNGDWMSASSLLAHKNDNLANKLGYLMAKFEAMKLVAKDSYNVVFKGQSDVLKLFTENHFEPVKAFGLENFHKTILGLFDATKSFIAYFKEGLGVAYESTKHMLSLIIKPFIGLKDVILNTFGKSTTEGMSNLKEIMKDVGIVAGSVLGTLVGFKVLKGLTTILVSPFKALLSILGKVGKKVTSTFSKLNPTNWYNKASMSKYQSIVSARSQVNRMTGRNFSESEFRAMGLGLTRSQRRASYISQKKSLEEATGRHFSSRQLGAMGIIKPANIFTATAKSLRDSFNLIGGVIKSRANLVSTNLSRNPNSKYNLANMKAETRLNNELKDVFFAGRKGYSVEDSIEVRKRPIWMDTLFGQRFSSVNSQGVRTNLGVYGGALTKHKDDNQMRLATQIVKPLGIDRSEFSSEKEYRNYMKSRVAPDRTTGLKAHSFFRNEDFNFRDKAYDRVSRRLGDYIGHGKAGAGQFRKNQWMSEEQKANIDTRRHQAVLGVLNNDQEELSKYNNRNTRKINDISSRVSHADNLNKIEDNEVFAKRQNFLSRALFGQKYYTVGQRENGQLYERQVARQGGLFNRPSQDNQPIINEPMRLSTSLAQDAQLLKAKVNAGLTSMGLKLKDLGQNIYTKFQDTSAYTRLSSAFIKFKSGLKVVFNPSTYKLDNIKGILDNIKSRVPQLATRVSNSLKGISQTIRSSELPKNAFDRIKLGLGNMKTNVINIGKQIASDLGHVATYSKNLIKGTSFFGKISSTGAYKHLSNAFGILGNTVKSTVLKLATNTREASTRIGSNFVSSSIFTGLTGAFSNLTRATISYITRLRTSVTRVASSLNSKLNLRGIFRGVGGKLKGLGSSIKGSLPMTFLANSMSGAKTKLSSAKDYSVNALSSFKQDTTLGRGFTKMGGIIAGSNTAKYFSSKLTGFKQGYANLRGNMSTGIASRLPQFMPTVGMGQGFLSRLGTGVVKGTGAVGRGVGALGKGAFKGVSLAGRGIGAVGRGVKGLGMGALGLVGGALGMIPQLALIGMLGSAVVGGVKNRGASLSDKDRNRLASKRGLKKTDNLGLGMAKISDDLSKFNFNKFWANFKKSSHKMIPIFKDIFRDIVRIGKQAFPVIFKEGKRLAVKFAKDFSNSMKNLPKTLGSLFNNLKPIVGSVWTEFKARMEKFLAEGLPKLTSGFKKVCSWVADNGIPLIVKGFSNLVSFVGTTVIPTLLEGVGHFVNWVVSTGIPTILTGLGKIVSSIISHLPEILSAIVGLLGNILNEVAKLGLNIISQIPGWVANLGSLIISGIQTALSGLGGVLSGLFRRALGGALSILPDVIEKPVRNILGVHHGGLYLSPDEHPAIIQEGETILPKGKAERLDAMLEGRAYWQQGEREKPRPRVSLVQKTDKSSDKPTYIDKSSHVSIEKVEVKVVADKLSKSDARKQALLIMEEFKRIQKENNLRNSTKKKEPVLV